MSKKLETKILVIQDLKFMNTDNMITLISQVPSRTPAIISKCLHSLLILHLVNAILKALKYYFKSNNKLQI